MADLTSHQLRDSSFVVIEVTADLFSSPTRWNPFKAQAEILKGRLRADAIVVTCGDKIEVV